MNKFLSIGEVCKLKGVTHTSLRYYDELGILKPAYVNPQTKYRYYSIDQLVTLDIILLCIELEIPLKNFLAYKTTDGTIDMNMLLADGKAIAMKKISDIQTRVEQLESFSDNMNCLKNIKARKEPYSRYIQKRCLLISKWENSLDNEKKYYELLTNLYFYVKKHKLTFLYNQGVLIHHHKNEVNCYVFLEVKQNNNLPNNTLILPSGNYQCEIYKSEQLLQIGANYTRPIFEDGTLLICTELFEAYIDNHLSCVEVQQYYNKNLQLLTNN